MGSPRLRSLLVGLGSAALDVVLFALCTLFWTGGAALVVARWACAAASAVGNFCANRIWAFDARQTRLSSQLARYALAAGVGISLSTFVWWLLMGLLALDPRLTHLLSLALVWILFTFPILRAWVFKPALLTTDSY